MARDTRAQSRKRVHSPANTESAEVADADLLPSHHESSMPSALPLPSTVKHKVIKGVSQSAFSSMSPPRRSSTRSTPAASPVTIQSKPTLVIAQPSMKDEPHSDDDVAPTRRATRRTHTSPLVELPPLPSPQTSKRVRMLRLTQPTNANVKAETVLSTTKRREAVAVTQESLRAVKTYLSPRALIQSKPSKSKTAATQSTADTDCMPFDSSEFVQIHSSQLPDLSLFGDDPNDDLCCICGHGGQVLSCDECVVSVHLYCAYIDVDSRFKMPGQYAHGIECIDDLPEKWTCSHMRRLHSLRERPTRMCDDLFPSERVFKWTSKHGARVDRGSRRAYHTSFYRFGESYAIGDAVLTTVRKSDLSMLDGDSEERIDFIGEIIELFAEPSTPQSNVSKNYMTLRWFYAPEHTMYGRQSSHEPFELFTTAHCDTQEVDSIQCRVSVFSHAEFLRRQSFKATDDFMYFTRLMYDDDRGEFRRLIDDEPDEEEFDVKDEDRRSKKAKSQSFARRKIGSLYASESALFPPSLPSLASELKALKNENARVEPVESEQTSQADVFARAAALLQLSSLPARLPCRESERQRLHDFVSSAVAPSGQASVLYMCGSPGLGKSCLVRQVVRELKIQSLMQHGDESASVAPFQYIEVNAMKLSDPLDLYSELLCTLTGKRCTQSSRALELLDAQLQQSATKASRHSAAVARGSKSTSYELMIVLLVDEIDYILNKCQSVIYNLFDWPSRPGSRLTVLGVSNTLDLPAMLLPRVQSRLGLASVKFMPYNKDQLATIVRERLSRATNGKQALLTDDAIELCARKIASVSGDVRRALQICRRAVEIGEQTYHAKIAQLKHQSNSSNQSATTAVPCVTVQHVESAICDLLDSNPMTHLRSVELFGKVLLQAFCLVLKQHATSEQHKRLAESESNNQSSAAAAAAADANAIDSDHRFYSESDFIPFDVLHSRCIRLCALKGLVRPYPTSAFAWHACALRLGHLGLLQRRQRSPVDRFGVWKMDVPEADVQHAFKKDQEWAALTT